VEVLATAIRTQKEIRGIQISKEEIKCPLFADNMVLYRENPKDSTKKVLELINKLSKTAGYKINIQKPVAFLYTNNEAAGKETKKTISFTIASKIVRYLGMNLTKEIKDL